MMSSLIPGPEQPPVRSEGPTASDPASALVSGAFSACDGMVLHRGCYLPTDTAIKLLARLQGQRWAVLIAAELSDAIAQVSEQELERHHA